MVATRDPRSVADHGRITVLRTCITALEDSFGQVFVFFTGPPAEPGRMWRSNTTFLCLPSNSGDRLANAAKALASTPRSLNLAAGITNRQVRAIRTTLHDLDEWPDLFVLDGARSTPVLGWTGRAAVHVDLDDLLSERYSSWASLPFSELPFDIRGTRPSSPLNSLARRFARALPAVLNHEARASDQLELEVCATADSVSVVSSSEARRLEDRANRPVQTLPMAAPTASAKWEPPDQPLYDAVFVGCATYLPNLAGLSWLAREVCPAFATLTGRSPNIAVVGQATPAVERWLRQLGLQPLGFIDDLAPVFGQSAVAVAPQTVEGGLKTKVLDYASHGIPVIGTPMAFRGLDHMTPTPWTSAPDAESFAYSMARLGEQKTLALELGERAQQYIEQHFGEPVVTERWIRAFMTALEHRRCMT